jgi:predicted transposase YdaD
MQNVLEEDYDPEYDKELADWEERVAQQRKHEVLLDLATKLLVRGKSTEETADIVGLTVEEVTKLTGRKYLYQLATRKYSKLLAEERTGGHDEEFALGHTLGHSKGYSQGRADGITEGGTEARFEMAEKALSNCIPMEDVTEITGLTAEEYTKWQAQSAWRR